jgi:hypothetical protein
MEDLAMAGKPTPESWVGQSVVNGRVVKGVRSRIPTAALSPAMTRRWASLAGRLDGVNELGATLATEDGRLAFFPWTSVARIVLPREKGV